MSSKTWNCYSANAGYEKLGCGGHTFWTAEMDLGPWNWLEAAKLLASVLTPLALAALGIYVHRVTKRYEHGQWRSQKLVEKRLSVYEQLAPDLNDLLCYFTYVGCWRDLDPPTVVALKRSIDKQIFLAAPLFSAEFFGSCMAFQSLCFETYNGWGQDAQLRTATHRRRESRKDWKDEWENCFSRKIAEPNLVRAAYAKVMESFSRDIGVHPQALIPDPGKPPTSIV